MALSKQFVAAFATASQDLLLAQVGHALAGVNILGLHPFDFLNQWANDLQQKASDAINNSVTITQGITAGATGTSSSNASDVLPAVQGMNATATANSAAIAGLTATANATVTGGVAEVDNFHRADSSNLGSSYTQGGSTAPNPLGVYSNVAQLQPVNSGGNGTRWALSNIPTATDDQSVIAVAATGGTPFAMTSLVCRATATMSSFVYLNVYSNKAYIGYGTFSGGTFTPHDWDHISINLTAGSTVELRAVGNVYTALLNGNPILTHTDSSLQSPVGSSNRSVGFMLSEAAGLLYYGGWGLSSFNYSDLAQVATVGTGWSLFRGATGSQALCSSTGGATLIPSVFDTQRNVANVTVNSTGSGMVTIQKAGWYHIDCRFNMSSAGKLSYPVLYGSTSTSGTFTELRRGKDTWDVGSVSGDTNPEVAKVISCTVYCPVGYVLCMGANVGSTSHAVIGNGAGSLTYFDGALMNA